MYPAPIMTDSQFCNPLALGDNIFHFKLSILNSNEVLDYN